MAKSNKNTLEQISGPEKLRLKNRVRRLRGQLDAVERSLEEDAECRDVLLLLSACRGGVNSLMAEILEEHIQHQLAGHEKGRAADLSDDLVDIVRAYFK